MKTPKLQTGLVHLHQFIYRERHYTIFPVPETNAKSFSVLEVAKPSNHAFTEGLSATVQAFGPFPAGQDWDTSWPAVQATIDLARLISDPDPDNQ